MRSSWLKAQHTYIHTYLLTVLPSKRRWQPTQRRKKNSPIAAANTYANPTFYGMVRSSAYPSCMTFSRQIKLSKLTRRRLHTAAASSPKLALRDTARSFFSTQSSETFRTYLLGRPGEASMSHRLDIILSKKIGIFNVFSWSLSFLTIFAQLVVCSLTEKLKMTTWLLKKINKRIKW